MSDRGGPWVGEARDVAVGPYGNLGQALGAHPDFGEAARDLQAIELLGRLGEGLKGAGGGALLRSCPPLLAAVADFDAGQFTVRAIDGTLRDARQLYSNSNRRGRVKKSIVTKIRENGFGSFLMLPGDATIEIGYRAARVVGARKVAYYKVAYYVDETRQPGNDMGYLLIVALSWLLLFKALMIVVAIGNRFGPSGIAIDAGRTRKIDRKLLDGPG